MTTTTTEEEKEEQEGEEEEEAEGPRATTRYAWRHACSRAARLRHRCACPWP